MRLPLESGNGWENDRPISGRTTDRIDQDAFGSHLRLMKQRQIFTEQKFNSNKRPGSRRVQSRIVDPDGWGEAGRGKVVRRPYQRDAPASGSAIHYDAVASIKENVTDEFLV